MKAAVEKYPGRSLTLNGQCPAPLSPFSILQKTGFEIAKTMFVFLIFARGTNHTSEPEMTEIMS